MPYYDSISTLPSHLHTNSPQLIKSDNFAFAGCVVDERREKTAVCHDWRLQRKHRDELERLSPVCRLAEDGSQVFQNPSL